METTGTYRQDFSAKWGLGTPFAITNDGLVFGNVTYSYSQLSQITLISAPANSLMNGSAQTTADHRTLLQLNYQYSQHEAFLQAMGYANERINQLSKNTKQYKFLLQAENGNKVEVYDSYIVLYCDDSNIMTTLKLVQQSMVLTRTIMMDKLLDVRYTAPTNEVTGSLCFLDTEMPQPEKKNTISVSLSNASLAQSIVNFITETKASGEVKTEVSELPQMIYETEQAVARQFPFMGETLSVPEQFDATNTIRNKYLKLAALCADRFKQQYQMQIHDYNSFMQEFPAIYTENMQPMLQFSMDALVAEGIWTVTKEAFEETHKSKYDAGYRDWAAMYSAGEKTVAANKEYVATATNTPRITRAGGFGFKNAMKAINQANLHNAMADALQMFTTNNTGINSAQQWELFNRIDLDTLALRVYCDYRNMWMTLVNTLNQNGKTFWGRMKTDDKNFANIFQNLTNPNFPQNQIPTILLELIQIAPYTKDYYKFMQTRFGETEEVKAICEYFGYGDLNDPRTL